MKIQKGFALLFPKVDFPKVDFPKVDFPKVDYNLYEKL